MPDGTLERINAIAAAERQPVQANGEALFELENGVEVQIDQPVDAVAADFPELEQRVHVPQVLEDPVELMAADDHPFEEPVAESADEIIDETVDEHGDPPDSELPADMPPVTVERRYPSRSNRTSYKDDRIYNMTLKKALNLAYTMSSCRCLRSRCSHHRIRGALPRHSCARRSRPRCS